MTNEEKDKVIYEVMKLHAGNGLRDSSLSHLSVTDVWKWIYNMNKALSDTPFMYMLCADAGVQVVLRAQALHDSKAMEKYIQ